MRRGDLIEAWTEYDLTTDPDFPTFAEIEVVFRITHPGCPPSYSNLDGGDPGDPPEAEIASVWIEVVDAETGFCSFVPAPPHIDAWARQDDREWTLFQQALDRA